MGTVKYSEIKSSNGVIKFNASDSTKIQEFDCDNYEYLRVYMAMGGIKVYINNSSDFILVGGDNGLEELILKDFAINHVKFELADIPGTATGSLQYYLCK
ncbi:hypothetical protein [Clostridium ljungdahlii]|uniref:Uncharacterized protein n=1 Tax=Clostridium ljungdahlii (strain ATCC 55383 / DSM 13528 / PETC) TaxID=748727 RepID=D8GU88_CLOLD|nr:hypothetical protein [Clostridium ljungdahlii]ADK14751.1 conserved hypothetical protein [Clostridium ljungdahlii DSM 13528]OAA84108.1 hypothetical protein WX45_01952 [Clostridium ljungdahlii DSM 13528]